MYGCRRSSIQHSNDCNVRTWSLMCSFFQFTVMRTLLCGRTRITNFFYSGSDCSLPCYKYAERGFQGGDLLLALASSASSI